MFFCVFFGDGVLILKNGTWKKRQIKSLHFFFGSLHIRPPFWDYNLHVVLYLVRFSGFYSRCRWWKVRWLNWKWTGDRTRGMRAWRPASVPALRTAAAPSPFSGRQCRCSPAGCRRFLRKCRGLSRPPHLPKRDERFGNSCTFNLTKVQMSANGTKTWTNQSTNQSMQ